MYKVIPAIIVDISDDYDLVHDFLKFLFDNKTDQFRGGMSGRGSYIGYFPVSEAHSIREFLSNYDPERNDGRNDNF